MPGIQLAGTGQALDQSLPTIITGFKLLRDYDGVVRRLATPMKLEAHTGSTKEILNYGRVAAYNVADGVDIAQAQDLSDARTSVTPSELAVQVVLGGRTMDRVADPALLRRTGQIMENAYNLKEDGDGCTMFDSFSTSIGSANAVLGANVVGAAAVGLMVGNNTTTPEPAPDPIVGVFHPCCLNAVMNRLIPLTDVPIGTNVNSAPSTAGQTIGPGRSGMSDDLLRRGLKALGTLASVPIYMDANFILDSNGDVKNGVYSKEGIIYLSEIEPRLDPEKDASLRGGVELNLWGSYGWQLYRAAAFGVEVLGDATLPTA